MIKTFDKSELEIRGKYTVVDTNYGYPDFGVNKLSNPVTPKENLKLFLERKDFYWVPNFYNDVNIIYPDIIPDCFATKMEGGFDSFGVEWTPTHPELGLPAFVEPGKPTLTDIADWKEVLSFPDVDSWDWEGSGKKFKEGLCQDRINVGILQSGFFERLIALMDFQYAAMALLEDPDSVKEFFDKIADYNIDVMEHFVKYHDIEMILIHDDWGAQRSPFFSHDTLQDVIIPYYKRMADRAHELGLYVMTHCCGCSETFVPEMIEAGSDIWQLQLNANPDIIKTMEKYKDKIFFEITEAIESSLDLESFKIAATEMYEKYAVENRTILGISDEFMCNSPEREALLYEISRKIAIQ